MTENEIDMLNRWADPRSTIDRATAARIAIKEIARLKQIILQKNVALEVFADPKMWAQWGRFVNVWNGADAYEDPREFARREMMREE